MKQNHIDIYVADHERALALGVQLCGCAFDEVRRDCHTLGKGVAVFYLREIALQ